MKNSSKDTARRCVNEEVLQTGACLFMPDRDGCCILPECVLYDGANAPRFTVNDDNFQDEYTKIESK